MKTNCNKCKTDIEILPAFQEVSCLCNKCFALEYDYCAKCGKNFVTENRGRTDNGLICEQCSAIPESKSEPGNRFERMLF